MLLADGQKRCHRLGKRPSNAPVLQNDARQLVAAGQLLQLLFCRGQFYTSPARPHLPEAESI